MPGARSAKRPSMPRDQERQRAAYAWKYVAVARGLEGKDKVKQRYRGQARGAAALIQRNGLGQALAFWASKGFNDQQPAGAAKAEFADVLLYRQLGAWLLQELAGRPACKSTGEIDCDGVAPNGDAAQDPIAWLTQPDRTLQDAMRATREALALINWLRRFADSQLPRPKTANGQQPRPENA